jgi:soluble lytic murein transglycosylase-like protein
MRRLILATIATCCAVWPCAASPLEPIPSQWAWPPAEAKSQAPSETVLSLPPVLVSASRFRFGLSDDLRRNPVPAIADQVDDKPADVFPDIEAELAILEDVPLPRPRVELTVRKVPIEDVCETLADAARAHKLPVPFFIRLIWQESRFDPGAISPVGAQGVAQFMPATAAAMGLKNPFDPLEALRFSARLLRELLGQFGNLGLAAAAYNAGPKRIVDWLEKRGNLPEETRNYVHSITGHAAERWRVTRPGRLALDVPQRAPCKGAYDFAHSVEVPAPPPPPPKRPRTRLLAKKKGDQKASEKVAERKGKDKAADKVAEKRSNEKAERKGKNKAEPKKKTASRKKAPEEVSAARKKGKPRAAAKKKKK